MIDAAWTMLHLRIYLLCLLLFHDSLQDVSTALKQFASQLDQLFTHQSRISYVKQNILSQFNGKLKLQKIVANEVRKSVGKQLENIVRLKVTAIRRLVEKAELSLRVKSYEVKALMTEEECHVASQEAGLSDTRFYDQSTFQNSYGRSVVHIAVDSYICENQVWDDFVWTNSNFIKEAFVKNSVTDRTLKTQYIATNTGLTRIYPSRKWHMEPESVTVDLFDPRYRPWFIAAQSAPKDVLFLIDMSGSVKGQTIHLIRMTILHILTTLGPNDYMNAIWFNTRREFALRGCSNGFIPATTLNKKILREHLEHLEERDQANLTPALELSFKIFSEGRLNVSKFWEFNNAEHSSGGHKLIMLFTDFDEEHPASVFENYNPTLPNNPIKIFGFSMGFGTGPLSVLNYLACRTNGGHFVVDSVSDVRHQAINYLTKLSELLHNAFSEKPLFLRPISWSNLMMDVQGGGPVITLSLPIFSQVRNRSQVAAVAGLDIELKQLVKVLPNNDQIYAFIIDNNGIVIYHPKLKLPQTELYAIRRTACFDRRSRQRATSKIQFTQTDETVLKLMGLFDSIPTYDIKDFERNSNKFFEFRTAMIDRNCSEESIVDNDREYFCVPVDGTPLVVGFVFFPKNTAVTLESDFKKPKYFTSSLVGYLITDQRICEGAINQYNVNERFDVLMGSSFCDKDLNHMNAIVAASKRWIQHWPKLESNSTCASTPLPNGFDAFYHILSFIHTPTGFTAFYPNCSTKPIHSALETFQHRQSSIDGNANKLHIFPTFLTPTTLVVHKNIYDSTYNKHLATVGVIWTASFLASFFRNFTETANSSDWNICFEQKRCHIVTETGHIVAGFSANRHLTSVDIFVFHELIKKSYATKWTVLDPQSHCSPLRWYFYPSNAAAPRPHSLITILFRLTKLLTSTFWIELVLVLKTAIRYVQTQPLPMEDRCVYSETSHDELCTMEYPNYAIRINTTQYFYVNTGKCMRDVRIFPIPDTSLYLFVMQKPCENETVPESLRKQYFSSVKRVPDCALTANMYRKRRSDLDYTRSHPQESHTPCSSSAKLGLSFISTVIFIECTFFAFFVINL